MTPHDLMDSVEARLWGVLDAGRNPWAAGARMLAQRLGAEAQLLLDGVVETGAGFARVVQAPGDPRRFVLPAGEAERGAAVPVLLLPVGDPQAEADDVMALALAAGSRRFWRQTCACDWLGTLAPDGGGVLRLRQDAHGFVGALLKSEAYGRRGREEREGAVARGLAAARAASGVESFVAARALPVEDTRRGAYLDGFKAALRAGEAAQARWAMAASPPAGALVLDPAAIEWTRRGVLGDAEWIEILDAPEDGPLGRALKRLNPRIGTKHGVGLVGQPKTQRRAAA